MKINITMLFSVAFVLGSFASCYGMENAPLSSSKKRKLRRNRALNEQRTALYLEQIILERLLIPDEKNKPTQIPLEHWFPIDQSEPTDEENISVYQNVQAASSCFYTSFLRFH